MELLNVLNGINLPSFEDNFFLLKYVDLQSCGTFRYKVIALHSILSTQDQAAAFTLPPQGVRKVKLSTSNLYVIHLRTVHENDYHQRQLLSAL